MAATLASQCFAEGFGRQLAKLASTGLVKQAITPGSAGRVLTNPLVEREMALLGEKLFRQSYNQPSILKGLKSVFMPGYGQTEAMHSIRNNYLDEIRRLSGTMRSLGPSHPAYSSVAQSVADKTRMFRGQKHQLFQEIGTVAKPRLDFIDKTLPMSGGLAAGGAAGYGVGNVLGSRDTREDIRGRLKDVPLMTRLKYLINPEGTF